MPSRIIGGAALLRRVRFVIICQINCLGSAAHVLTTPCFGLFRCFAPIRARNHHACGSGEARPPPVTLYKPARTAAESPLPFSLFRQPSPSFQLLTVTLSSLSPSSTSMGPPTIQVPCISNTSSSASSSSAASSSSSATRRRLRMPSQRLYPPLPPPSRLQTPPTSMPARPLPPSRRPRHW
jgi:hypothetical protein